MAFQNLETNFPLQSDIGGFGIHYAKILRQPLITVDKTVQFILDTEDIALDKETEQRMHIGAFLAVQDLLKHERRLIIGSYNISQRQVNILMGTGEHWVECYTIDNRIIFCESKTTHP